jgi:hypothetical protein
LLSEGDTDPSAEFYKHHPYPKDYQHLISERSLVPSGPLDHLQESFLGITFQLFVLSRHRSVYWGYIVRYDLLQADAYFREDNSDHWCPDASRDVIDMLAEAMARVGFLRLSTSRIPGAIDAWIDHVLSLAELPIPCRVPFSELKFFEYSSETPKGLSREFSFNNPFLADPFYTEYLKYEALEEAYYDDPENWYYDFDEEALHNLSTTF